MKRSCVKGADLGSNFSSGTSDTQLPLSLRHRASVSRRRGLSFQVSFHELYKFRAWRTEVRENRDFILTQPFPSNSINPFQLSFAPPTPPPSAFFPPFCHVWPMLFTPNRWTNIDYHLSRLVRAIDPLTRAAGISTLQGGGKKTRGDATSKSSSLVVL